MHHVPTLITDLAIILTYAGVFTLIFKKLKQPLVLGYIVAGFLATSAIPFTPSIEDDANVALWADLGVIFLLFSLGLEFSFKKIVRMGAGPIIAMVTMAGTMMCLGLLVGSLMGWSKMNCIFLGGMIAMSSTTIIYKAFEDMGLRQKKFAQMVLSILILEDVLAIVFMVLLSTFSVADNFEGMDLVYEIGKLIFFLVLWFTVGIYLIPTIFRYTRKLMSDETMLVVSLGLCFVMVYLAANVGFSPAFGAFIMGSLLAETIECEKIEHLTKPIKDLFGAVFFVSVGMMVDPTIIMEYWLPITIIVLLIVIGKASSAAVGVLLSGAPLRMAMQCGFSLTQIGEFSFIIATLGKSLGVIDDFLYPVIVAVSLITTFMTPYLIRLADPSYAFLQRHVSPAVLAWIDQFSQREDPIVNDDESAMRRKLWRQLLSSVGRIVLINGILIVALLIVCYQFVVPLLHVAFGETWGDVIGALLSVVSSSPFLRSIVVKKNHSQEIKLLRESGRLIRLPLFLLVFVKWLIALAFVVAIILVYFEPSILISILIAGILVSAMVASRRIKKQSISIERRFMRNFRVRETYNEYNTRKSKPSYAGSLLTRSLHLTVISLPENSPYGGCTLAKLNLGNRFGIHIAGIIRGDRHIYIPGGSDRIFPGDDLQVIGTDEAITNLTNDIDKTTMEAMADISSTTVDDLTLHSIALTALSPLCGVSVRQSRVREDYALLIVGIERDTMSETRIDTNMVLQEGDTIWLVGKEADIRRLGNAKIEIPEEV